MFVRQKGYEFLIILDKLSIFFIKLAKNVAEILFGLIKWMTRIFLFNFIKKSPNLIRIYFRHV